VANPLQPDERKTIDVAVKILVPLSGSGSEYDIKGEWRNELAAHRELGRLRPPEKVKHIVKAIAAFQHRGLYCFVFEWADGRDLRHHWQSTKHCALSPSMVRDYLGQFLGLTGALNVMHNTKDAKSRRGSAVDDSVPQSSSGDQLGESHFRDLKDALGTSTTQHPIRTQV
jgi:serine/threonine protein kinase